MRIREAAIDDIDNFMVVRMAVKENVLNSPGLFTRKDNTDHSTIYGKKWVCEDDNYIVGVAIAGLTQRNIWALFVQAGYEKKKSRDT